MQRLREHPQDLALIRRAADLLETLGGLALNLDLGQAQNDYFEICQGRCQQKGATEDRQGWNAAFDRLGRYLYIQCR